MIFLFYFCLFVVVIYLFVVVVIVLNKQVIITKCIFSDGHLNIKKDRYLILRRCVKSIDIIYLFYSFIFCFVFFQ